MSSVGHGARLAILLIWVWPVVSVAKPYREAPRQGDHLTVWGWSKDERQFAYETWANGGGSPLDCYDEAVLTFLDTRTDHPAPGGVIRSVTRPGADPDHCVNPDVRATLSARRSALLRSHGVTAHASRALAFRVAADGRTGAVALPSGHLLHATFSGRAIDPEVVAAHPDRPAFAYHLVLSLDGRVVRTIDAGPWPSALGTGLADARVFISPSGRTAALCLPVSYMAHHGVWARWDCHGLSLSRAP